MINLRPTMMPRRFAFTLIELLVVISLIALLIGILMVALRGARENARATQCQSNLRQIGMATQAYTVDNDNFLPYEDRGDEAMGFVCWVDVLHGDSDGDGTPDSDSYLERVEAEESTMQCPSVSSAEAFSLESYRINSKLQRPRSGKKAMPHTGRWIRSRGKRARWVSSTAMSAGTVRPSRAGGAIATMTSPTATTPRR